MEKYLTRINAVRIVAFLGAAAAAGVEALGGNYVNAFGIVMAALSAAGLKGNANITRVE